MTSHQIAAAAAELVEAVRTDDADWVREILTSPVAAEVAVEVAGLVLRTRRDDERHRLRRLEADFRTVAGANRRLIRERAALRARLTELRESMRASAERRAA